MTSALSAVVLAAGEGTRMRSCLPKPVHRLCGKPMVIHVLDALASTSAERVVVVVGHGADQVQQVVTAEGPKVLDVRFAKQPVRRGTGDAAQIGLDAMEGEGGKEHRCEDVLVLFGDTPLLRADTLLNLVGAHRESGAAATLLVAELKNPYGYGRILRDKGGELSGIVEEKDATKDQRSICEVNTGIAIYRRGPLADCLHDLEPSNESGEYYLTDVASLLRQRGERVATETLSDESEANGVNDRAQLAAAAVEMRDRINRGWARNGVTFIDPSWSYIDAQVRLGPDVTIYPGVVLEGETVIGEGSTLYPGVHLTNCHVGRGVTLEQVVGVDTAIEEGRSLGPYTLL